MIAVAIAIQTVSFFGSSLWAAPDTSYYVELAGGIVERGDFRSQLFLVRPPGYPLMLAGIFWMFGPASSTALLVVQHGMVAVTAVLIAAIAWNLTGSHAATVAAGILAAAGPQLTAFANVVMTEAPYAFVFVLSVYWLVKYNISGRRRWLGLASAAAGLSYLFRPIGMAGIAACGLAALLSERMANGESRMANEPGPAPGGVGRSSTILDRGERRMANQEWRMNQDQRRAVWAAHSPFWIRHSALPLAGRLRPGLAGLAVAVVPAFIVTAPAMIQNKLIHGGDLSARCADLALYFRVAYMDKLESEHSTAARDIRAVVAETVDRGFLPPGSDHRLWGQVWKAYEAVRGVGLTEASAVMGQAARDAVCEHPWQTIKLSAKYCYWMLMVPDSFYRFHPGGAPATVTPEGECVRDQQADILDAATYEPMMRPWTGPYEKYLRLSEAAPGPTTPIWTATNRWFYRNIEKGPTIRGFTPYEAFTWVCLLSALGCLFTRQRAAWLLVIAAIGSQIAVSAVLAGPTPRYAVPVQPLLVLFPVAISAALAHRLAAAASHFAATPRPGLRPEHGALNHPV